MSVDWNQKQDLSPKTNFSLKFEYSLIAGQSRARRASHSFDSIVRGNHRRVSCRFNSKNAEQADRRCKSHPLHKQDSRFRCARGCSSCCPVIPPVWCMATMPPNPRSGPTPSHPRVCSGSQVSPWNSSVQSARHLPRMWTRE